MLKGANGAAGGGWEKGALRALEAEESAGGNARGMSRRKRQLCSLAKGVRRTCRKRMGSAVAAVMGSVCQDIIIVVVVNGVVVWVQTVRSRRSVRRLAVPVRVCNHAIVDRGRSVSGRGADMAAR